MKDAPTVTELVLTFPQPDAPPTINYLNSMQHWAQRDRALKPWREWTALSWWKVKRTRAAQVLVGVPCLIEVTFSFATKRKRDPHNYVGSVVKAMIDQLVHEGVWPDDDPRWVSVVEPVLQIDSSPERECHIRLVPKVIA